MELLDFNFYGVTFPELVRFVVQVGLAVAGGAAFWGMVFSWKTRQLRGGDNVGAELLTRLLFRIFNLGFILFLTGWFFEDFVVFAQGAMAHEGITIRNVSHDLIRAGLEVSFPFVVVAGLVALAGLVLYRVRNASFMRFSKEYFMLQFLLVSLLMYLSTFTGELSGLQAFFFFHSWHSIFTVGSVVVVDVLYIGTLRNDNCRRVLYRLFPWISNGIWIGLGLDTLANMLIYHQHDWTLPVFHFTQILVAVIIINGTLLSGRINEALVALIRPDGTVTDFPPGIEKWISLSGAVSIISWMTITFSDFFVLTTPWWLYFGAWAGLIAFVYLLRKPADEFLSTHAGIPATE